MSSIFKNKPKERIKPVKELVVKVKERVVIEPMPILSKESIEITIEGFKQPLWWSEMYGLDFEVFECLNYDYYQTVEFLDRKSEFGIIKKNQCKIIT